MPKKTKKQKIASQRRKLQFFPKNQAQPFSISQPINEKNDAPVSQLFVEKPKTPADTVSTQIFKKELVKSLFITGSILVIIFGIFVQQQFGILPISSLIK